MSDRFIPVELAAKRLCVCGETIRRWFRAGKIAGVRYPSGQYRISVAAVDQILQHSTQASTPSTPTE